MPETSNYTSFPKKPLPAMPTLNSVQLRQNILQCLRTARFESSIHIPDLTDYTTLQEALGRSPFFLVGDPERPHTVAGDVVLGIHWPTLLKNLLFYMSNDKWIVPLIWSLRSIFTSKYPIMSNLLYRATATSLALNWPHAPDNMSPLYLLKDAFPLSPQEEATLEHYCAQAAGDKDVVAALQRCSAGALQSFVMFNPAKGLKRFPFARGLFVDCEYTEYLFLDFKEFDAFNYKAHKWLFPPVLDLPVSSFPYPSSLRSLYQDLFCLSQLCPVDDESWSLPLSSRIEGWSEDANIEVGRRNAMQYSGVYTDQSRDLCIVNFSRVPLGFIFGPTSNCSKVSSAYAVGGSIYSTLPVDHISGELSLSRDQAEKIAVHLDYQYADTLVVALGSKASRVVNYYISEGVWEEEEKRCIFAFPLSLVKQKLLMLQSKFSTKRKPGRHKGGIVKPPSDFLTETYTQVVQGITLPLEVRFTHHLGNLFSQFISLPFTEEWLTMLLRDPECHKIKDAHIKYWVSHPTPFLSLNFLRRLLQNDEYREKSCIADPTRFLTWLESQALDRKHFKRLCRLKKMQAKAANCWAPSEDDQIKLYLRVGMKKAQRDALLNLLPNRTMKDIIQRAKVIREQLLAAGIKDVRLYPRMRYIPGLNEKIKALP